MPGVGFTRVEKSGFVTTIYISLLRKYFYLPIAQESLQAVVTNEKSLAVKPTLYPRYNVAW
jgi:hypothetical protein